MAAARQNVPAREAVNLKHNISQIFPSGQNQLQFQSIDIFNNIEKWIGIEVGGGDAVYDNLSIYMVCAFTTLLDSFIRQRRISDLDKLTIVKHLNKTMIRSLHLLDDSRDGAYTEFCSYFFGASDGKEARDILEALSADSQCNAVIGKPIFGTTRCWICNLKLSGITKPQCEHILPIIDALFYLNLYQYTNSFDDLGAFEQAILILEYLWSEKCCNETKNNDQWLAFDADGICSINRDAILASMERIAEAADNPEGGRECWEHLREYVGGKIKAKVDGKANIDRISVVLQPIVETINSIVRYIDNRLQSDARGKTQAIRAITVFKYLTLIRFLSNISGSKMVEAFMNNVVNTNAAAKAARRQELEARKASERAAERAEVEQRKAERAAAIAAKQAEKESDKNRRLRAELTEEIKKLSEVEIPNYERLLREATSDRGKAVQERQIQRVQLSIAKLQEELDALPMAGGQRGGAISYEKDILSNFDIELRYIMLLSFYPIYINRTNKGNSLSEEEYMSTENIVEMAMAYFQPKETELINIGAQKVMPKMVMPPMTPPRVLSNKMNNMLGTVAPATAASPVSFAPIINPAPKFNTLTKKRKYANNKTNSNNTNMKRRKVMIPRSKTLQPLKPVSPFAMPLEVEMSYGGRTRKHRQKRITRKKSNH